MIKWLFYGLTALLPTALWLSAPGQQLIFTNGFTSLSSVAKWCGLVGISIYAGNLILAGRFRFLDQQFKGLDKLYRFHHQSGLIAFGLILVHVLTVTWRLVNISWATAGRFWLDASDLPNLYGKIALLGFVVIILITLTVHWLRYERLRQIHSALGFFFFFGGLHAFFIPSDIAQNQLLRWYVLSLAGAGLVVWLWRSVLLKIFHTRTTAPVIKAVRVPSPQITEIALAKPTPNFQFKPGQFVFLKFLQAGFPREEHPFSLTSIPGAAELTVAAKALGDFTSRLPELKPETSVVVRGPFGGFNPLETKNHRQLWLAGGIGITPFLSAARTFRDQAEKFSPQDFSVVLIWSVKEKSDLIYQAELEALAAEQPGFRFEPWISSERGPLLAEQTDYQERDVFLCGPQAMQESLRQQFLRLGCPTKRLHLESFKLL